MINGKVAPSNKIEVSRIGSMIGKEMSIERSVSMMHPDMLELNVAVERC